MSEEEIIRLSNELVEHKYLEDIHYLWENEEWKNFNNAIQGLLDLYNKEKALNEELQIRYKIENDKYKELKERINKSIEFINDDDTFFDDGESWQNVFYIERILKGE